MKDYVCTLCGYVYSPNGEDNTDYQGVAFEDLPDDYVCPICGAGKDAFEPAE